jgi:glycosyltransferase involved in cell wall biosynthesis
MAKLEPGGAQLAVLTLARSLREHGFETRMLAGQATADGVALCKSFGVPVEVFGGGMSLQYEPSKGFARWLRPRIEDADVIHAHMFGAWWAATRSAPSGVPLLASEHNAVRWPGRPRAREMRAALRRVDLFFAHGPEARRLVLELGLPADRLRSGISPVPGLDTRPGAGLPSPRIVFAGRLHPEKGPDVLVEALALMDRRPMTLMLGAGELEARLRARVAELGLSRHVCFAGWQDQPGSFIAGAAALAVPSRHEAWSQSAALAMGLGVPVVASAVEGLPLTLGAGRGVLVPPDDPASLAEALDEVIDGRRSVDCGAARDYAFRFAPARVASVYASAYRWLVAREARETVSAA